MCTNSHLESAENKGLEAPKLVHMQLNDYFFLDPIFIISMLVLFVIIVIIVSWWLQKRKLDEGSCRGDVESQNKRNKDEVNEKNIEVLEGLLDTIAAEEDGLEKHTTFGTVTGINNDGSSDKPSAVNGADGPPEVAFNPDKLATIIPDKDFRDFPKTEEERMKMRRANMIQMLALPPLT